MKIVTIAGKADSRVLVYPIAYLLNQFGRVLIVTDDGAYRRLYRGYGDDGESGGVRICFTPSLDRTRIGNIVNETEVDFVICVTTGKVPDYTQYLIALTGYDMAFGGNPSIAGKKSKLGKKSTGGVVEDLVALEEDKIELGHDIPSENIRTVVVSTKEIKNTAIMSICVKDGLLQQCMLCEEYKELRAPVSRDYLQILMDLLGGFIISDVSGLPQLCGYKK